jgi:hypothetical protein
MTSTTAKSRDPVIIAALGPRPVQPSSSGAGGPKRRRAGGEDEAKDASGGGLVVHELSTGVRLARHKAEGGAHGLALLGDEQILTSRLGRATTLAFAWGKEDPVGRFAAPEEVGPLAATSDGTFVVAGGVSGAVYTWEASTGALLSVTKAHYRAVTSLAFSPDNAVLVTGGEDAMVHVWDLAALCGGGAQAGDAKPLGTVSVCRMAVVGLSVGASRAALACRDHSVRVFDLARCNETFCASLPCAQLCVVLDALQDLVLCGGLDGAVRACAMSTGSVRTLSGHSGAVTCLASVRLPARNVTLVSGSDDASMRLWNVELGQAVSVIRTDGPVLFILATLPPAEEDQQLRKRSAVPVMHKFKHDEDTMRDRVVAMRPPRINFGHELLLLSGDGQRRDDKQQQQQQQQHRDVDAWRGLATRLYSIASGKFAEQL